MCIRRQGTDPATGTRYLEELAFEVVNEQPLRDITEKAEDLTARGVRRMVAVFVKKGEVCEWSPKANTWRKLDPEAVFTDPTLARPLRVRDLLNAAEADNAVARALLAKHNPVLVKAQDDSRAAGLRVAVRSLCRVLAIPLSAERQAAIERMSAAQLDALCERIERDRRWD